MTTNGATGFTPALRIAAFAVAAYLASVAYHAAGLDWARVPVEATGTASAESLPLGRAMSGSGPWAMREVPGTTMRIATWSAHAQSPGQTLDGALRCFVTPPGSPLTLGLLGTGAALAALAAAFPRSRGLNATGGPSTWADRWFHAMTSWRTLAALVIAPTLVRMAWTFWWGVHQGSAVLPRPEHGMPPGIAMGPFGVSGIIAGGGLAVFLIMRSHAHPAVPSDTAASPLKAQVPACIALATLFAWPLVVSWVNAMVGDELAITWIPY